MADTEVVTFAVKTQDVVTRAIDTGKGTYATTLYYGVYEFVDADKDGDKEWKLIDTDLSKTDEGVDFDPTIGTIVNLRLAKQKEYSVIFWAANADNSMCTVEWENRSMKVNEGISSNQESYDAFWAYVHIDAKDNTAPTKNEVTLVRPFAQLNIGVSNQDFADAITASVDVYQSEITVTSVPTSMDLVSGDVTGNAATTYNFANIPVAEGETGLNFPIKGYRYLALNYVLVGGNQENDNPYLVDIALNYTDTEEGSYSYEFTNVPVKRNYRTNIYGNLLTADNEYDVDIEPGFGEPDHEVYVWDGTEVKEPKVSEENDNIYEIAYASELAWLAAAVNGTLTEEYTRSTVEANDFKGKTFVLTEDIDLGGEEWTPIGSSSKIFKGTLDGQDHTVKNLVITGNNSNVGLFGQTQEGEIKNLTVENAKVSGRLNVGVVAGHPYTSEYTNITVKGHVEVNGLAYVGGVGGKNAYADWTNITVNVDETSYVKAHSIENGTAYRTYVGGVVGFNGEGDHKFSNITSNIDVEGSTQDVGGLFGIAHYGNQFENCVCTGNVEIYAAEEADEAQEIGGIAGVWHNGGANVVFTSCSFTGTLATNIEGVEFYYNGLVGKPYSATGTGRLIIDNVVRVASVEELQSVIDAATEGTTEIIFGKGLAGEVMVHQKNDVNIVINGDDKKFDGTIKIHNGSTQNSGKITIEKVKFETSTESLNFIMPNDFGVEDGVTRRYSQNVTVNNCIFTANGAAKNTAVGVQAKSCTNLQVIECTATDMHSLVQAQSCSGNVNVKSCTINGKNGVAFKQVKAATVEGTTITALEYGIRFDGNTDNYGIIVNNNSVEANQPFIVRKMTGANNTITLEGTNTLTTEAEYQIVITNGIDDEAYVKPTGTYTLTGADGYTVFPAPFPVASWDEFTAALAAGETDIKFTDNITYEGASSYNLKNDVKVEMNGKTFTTGNASTTWLNIMGSKAIFKNGIIEGKVYVQKNGSTYSDATFENVTFGGTITFSSVTQGSLAVQGGNSVYAKKCVFKGKGSTTPNVVSLEGTSSGSTIFEDCTFNSSMNRFYANPRNGSAIFKLINCSFNKAAVVETAASWDFVNNMTITGSKSQGVNLYIGKAKDSLTDEEKAVLDAYKKNNKGTVYCNSVKY